MFIDFNCFLRWAIWPMSLLLISFPPKPLNRFHPNLTQSNFGWRSFKFPQTKGHVHFKGEMVSNSDYTLIIFLLKRVLALNFLYPTKLCAKSGWNLPSGYREDFVKSSIYGVFILYFLLVYVPFEKDIVLCVTPPPPWIPFIEGWFVSNLVEIDSMVLKKCCFDAPLLHTCTYAMLL